MTAGMSLLGYAALNVYAHSSAVSPEALEVARRATEITQSAQNSQALFGEVSSAIEQLRALGRECAESGWDGGEAQAIDPMALRNAEMFLRALPDGIPMPELAPEPDGAISLDWIQSRHRLLSLSLGRTLRIAYAWLDGADRGHAVDRFDGLTVPRRLLTEIQAMVGNGDSLRAA
jgi:hypothetical protein